MIELLPKYVTIPNSTHFSRTVVVLLMAPMSMPLSLMMLYHVIAIGKVVLVRMYLLHAHLTCNSAMSSVDGKAVHRMGECGTMQGSMTLQWHQAHIILPM